MSMPHVCVCEKCRREMGESLGGPLWQTSQELKLAEEGLANATQELEQIKRTREQERDYADVCYENERLRKLLRLTEPFMRHTDLGRSIREALPAEPRVGGAR